MGILVVDLVIGHPLWKNDYSNCEENIEFFSQLADYFTYPFTESSQENFGQFVQSRIGSKLPPDLLDFIKQCLILNVENRPTAWDLWDHPFIKEFTACITVHEPDSLSKHVSEERDTVLEMMQSPLIQSPLERMPIHHVYYLWRLAGGSVKKEWYKQVNHAALPPIFQLPRVVRIEGNQEIGRRLIEDNELYSFPQVLSLKRLEEKLVEFLEGTISECHVAQSNSQKEECDDIEFVHVSLFTSASPISPDEQDSSQSVSAESIQAMKSLSLHDFLLVARPFWDKYNAFLPTISDQPLAIREADVVYQFMRVKLFTHLLLTYPSSKDELIKQAQFDIPPLFRGPVWACLLGLKGPYYEKYHRCDRTSPHPVDRQLEVDVPRCHQYHPLLNSPQGHLKLKKILKSWIVSNPNLTYWQGTTSIEQHANVFN